MNAENEWKHRQHMVGEVIHPDVYWRQLFGKEYRSAGKRFWRAPETEPWFGRYAGEPRETVDGDSNGPDDWWPRPPGGSSGRPNRDPDDPSGPDEGPRPPGGPPTGPGRQAPPSGPASSVRPPVPPPYRSRSDEDSRPTRCRRKREALRVLRSLAQASDGALTVDLDYEYLGGLLTVTFTCRLPVFCRPTMASSFWTGNRSTSTLPTISPIHLP